MESKQYLGIDGVVKVSAGNYGGKLGEYKIFLRGVVCMTKFDVVGFGALNVDMLFKVEKLAGAEEESFIEDYTEACGGSAANTMVGLARLGCKTGFIGKVANDREGKLQIDCFKTEGVDTNGIIEATKGKSGSVMGFVDKKGARALYINSGVNDTIEPREIKCGLCFSNKISAFILICWRKIIPCTKKALRFSAQ